MLGQEKKSKAGTLSRLLPLAPLVMLAAACTTVPLPPDAQGPRPAPGPQAVIPPPPPPVNPAEEQALRSLVAHQERLYRVAGPLLVKNTDLCKAHARNLLGFTAKNKFSYSTEFINAAQYSLGLTERLQVTGVLPDSGALRAGVRPGDVLLAVEGQPFAAGDNAERQAAALLAPLVTGRSNVNLTVLRAGTSQTVDVPLTFACAFGIELGNADIVNAYGDGQRVLITRGMMAFARSDDELAYVMAREMAHNALAHASRQKMNATIGGVIDNLVRIRPDMSTMTGTGGIRPMSVDMDVTADRLALYMLTRAGYNIDNVVPFWKRLANDVPATVLNGYTALHPNTSQRIAAMQRTITDIKNKKAGNKPLMP